MSDMNEHQHVFKETKVDISNGERFVTATCSCGAKKGYSKSSQTKAKTRISSTIHSKPEKK